MLSYFHYTFRYIFTACYNFISAIKPTAIITLSVPLRLKINIMLGSWCFRYICDGGRNMYTSGRN